MVEEQSDESQIEQHGGRFSSGSSRRSLQIGLLSFVLGLVVQLYFAQTPFDRGWESYMALYFQDRFSTTWAEQGFFACKGQPLMQVLPTREFEGELYPNHPPLGHWLVYLGRLCTDQRELGLRLAAILFSALSGAILAFIAARRFGVLPALGVTALYLSSPALFFYGKMANYEAFAMALGLLAVSAGLKLEGRRGLILSCGLMFLIGFIEWVAGLLALSIFIFSLRKPRRQLKRSLAMGASVALAFALYFLLLSYWTGSITDAVEALTKAVKQGHDIDNKGYGNGFWKRELDYLLGLFGPGLSLIWIAGLSVSLFRLVRNRCQLVENQILVWSLTSLMWILLLPGRARIHDFWLMYSSPAIILSAALVLHLLASKSRIVMALAVVAMATFHVRTIVDRYEAEHDGWNEEMAAWADEKFDENTLLVSFMVKRNGTWHANVKPWVYTGARTEEESLVLMERFRNNEFRSERIVFWYPSFVDRVRKDELELLIANGAQHESDDGATILSLERATLLRVSGMQPNADER